MDDTGYLVQSLGAWEASSLLMEADSCFRGRGPEDACSLEEGDNLYWEACNSGQVYSFWEEDNLLMEAHISV